jgi:3',5'-cyclic AMP phosphodiesterase CpdA
VAKPFVLVQISDPHIGATWAHGDPVARLRETVDAVRRLPDRPDAVLVTGDLADNGADDEYEVVRDAVAAIGAPVYVLPGNHDKRDALRRSFELDGDAGTPVRAAADLGPLRLVMLDSTVPGHDHGELDDEQLAWLDAELAVAPEQPTIVAMHHPPLLTGSDVWDEFALLSRARIALADAVIRHRNVSRIVAGHVHRTIVADLAGQVVLAIPSTYVQAELDLTSDELRFSDDPPAFALHTVVDRVIASHVQPVPLPSYPN